MEWIFLYFCLEFLNCFNGVIEFFYLSKDDLSEIVDLMFDEVN